METTGKKISKSPEVPEKPTRRRYTQEYKKRMIAEADLLGTTEHRAGGLGIFGFERSVVGSTLEAESNSVNPGVGILSEACHGGLLRID